MTRVDSNSERQAHVSTETRTTGLKAFDLCQTAASHVSSIGMNVFEGFDLSITDRLLVTVYHEHYNLRRASPFLSAYLLNAGVTHVVTRRRSIHLASFFFSINWYSDCTTFEQTSLFRFTGMFDRVEGDGGMCVA